MTLSYIFRPDDERRLLRIFGRVTMRMPFVVALAIAAPIFLFMGIALATEALWSGILVGMVGIGLVFRVAFHLWGRAKIRHRFREAVGTSISCAWVLDDSGITSTDRKEKMPWSSCSQAIMCPEGMVFVGNSFAWIPLEALPQGEEPPVLRQLLLKHRVRYEERT